MNDEARGTRSEPSAAERTGEGAVRLGTRRTRGRSGPGGLRQFWLRSEFLAMAATILAVLIAAAVADDLDAGRAWTLVTALVVAYIVSRGLAKRGWGHPD